MILNESFWECSWFQYFIFLRFFKLNSDEVDPKSQRSNENKTNSKFKLPSVSACLGKLNLVTDVAFSIPSLQTLLENLDPLQSSDNKTSSTKCVNLIMQFLFFELRSSNKVRKWFLRKLSAELDELLTKTTIGKFFSKLTVSRSLFTYASITTFRPHR